MCFGIPCYVQQATKPAFKSMELYSYTENGKNIKYALLIGANRNKLYEDIVGASVDLNVLIKKIKILPPEENIFWFNSSVQGPVGKKIELKYPDKDIIKKIKSICKEYRIILHLPGNMNTE